MKNWVFGVFVALGAFLLLAAAVRTSNYIQEGRIQQVSLAPPIECTDTDSGVVMYTQGSITIDSKTSTDYCADSKNLIEFYCATAKGSSYAASRKISCALGCANGACVKPKAPELNITKSG